MSCFPPNVLEFQRAPPKKEGLCFNYESPYATPNLSSGYFLCLLKDLFFSFVSSYFSVTWPHKINKQRETENTHEFADTIKQNKHQRSRSALVHGPLGLVLSKENATFSFDTRSMCFYLFFLPISEIIFCRYLLSNIRQNVIQDMTVMTGSKQEHYLLISAFYFFFVFHFILIIWQFV